MDMIESIADHLVGDHVALMAENHALRRSSVRVTYSDSQNLLMLNVEAPGLHASAFLHDIQDARMLLIQIGACIKEWERAEATDKKSLTVHTDNDGEPLA